MAAKECQIHHLPAMADPVSPGELIWQSRSRVKRIVKRRVRYLMNLLAGKNESNNTAAKDGLRHSAAAGMIEEGSRVRVRSKEEIQSTLNRWNQLNRCSFMEEMWPYCGTTQRVLKRVGKFLDERDYLIKKCRGVLILDGVMCQGTKDFGACDRSCFFFWREEWLEKIA